MVGGRTLEKSTAAVRTLLIHEDDGYISVANRAEIMLKAEAVVKIAQHSIKVLKATSRQVFVHCAEKRLTMLENRPSIIFIHVNTLPWFRVQVQKNQLPTSM